MQNVDCDRPQCFFARCRRFTGWFLTTDLSFFLCRSFHSSFFFGFNNKDNNSHLNVLWCSLGSVYACVHRVYLYNTFNIDSLPALYIHAISAFQYLLFVYGYVSNYATRPTNSTRKLIKIENSIPFLAIVPDFNSICWTMKSRKRKN